MIGPDRGQEARQLLCILPITVMVSKYINKMERGGCGLFLKTAAAAEQEETRKKR